MKIQLSDNARHVMSIAQREARDLQHEYVGTEHILLALIVERPVTLTALGLTAEDVRREIEKHVLRGPAAIPPDVELPLTPRAKRIISLANLEAMAHSQNAIEPEHLLVGLIHESEGVAGLVMRGLGLDLAQVRRESLKLRLAQMRIAERAVRPVRAGTKCKRKMREELLAHLSHIFEEELSRLGDTQAALAEAARRFGDPAQLAAELQRALPASERRNYHVERWFGWRAPESVVRMMLRTSLLSCCIVVVAMGLPLLGGIAVMGWDYRDAVALRTFAALALVLPVVQFLIGVLYYKLRGSLWGAFGAKSSHLGGVAYAVLISAVVMAFGAAAIGIMNASLAPVGELFAPVIAASCVVGLFCFLLARFRGPLEISDTTWACLELDPA